MFHPSFARLGQMQDISRSWWDCNCGPDHKGVSIRWTGLLGSSESRADKLGCIHKLHTNMYSGWKLHNMAIWLKCWEFTSRTKWCIPQLPTLASGQNELDVLGLETKCSSVRSICSHSTQLSLLSIKSHPQGQEAKTKNKKDLGMVHPSKIAKKQGKMPLPSFGPIHLKM